VEGTIGRERLRTSQRYYTASRLLFFNASAFVCRMHMSIRGESEDSCSCIVQQALASFPIERLPVSRAEVRRAVLFPDGLPWHFPAPSFQDLTSILHLHTYVAAITGDVNLIIARIENADVVVVRYEEEMGTARKTPLRAVHADCQNGAYSPSTRAFCVKIEEPPSCELSSLWARSQISDLHLARWGTPKCCPKRDGCPRLVAICIENARASRQ